MPKGPKGQKRPADVVGNAVRVMEIATGQREEECERSPDSNNTGEPKDPPSDQSTYQAVSYTHLTLPTTPYV